MPQREILEPELTWTGAAFERGVRVVVEDGRIAAVQRAAGDAGGAWTGRALLPGLVNAHSHAFQRGLRGRGERFPQGAGSFWTWRETMYGLVEAMDAATMYDLSRQAFEEMLAAGITTVGEFHYLHHDRAGGGFALDEAVLRAAAEAGIRLVLLQVYYRTGGIGEPLGGGQLRFGVESPAAYWRQLDALADAADPATQSVGVAAHSIRAVPVDELVELHREAGRRGLVFHMHVEEQPREIRACEAALGARPMAILNRRLDVDDRFCAVHCTHTDAGDLKAFLEAGGRVCICPLTEANLGDGIAEVPRAPEAHRRVCLGTDSNARICFAEEMRWLEYGQRLAAESRGICTDEGGACAAALLHAATGAGAAALGVEAGAIRPGAAADFVALDLKHPALWGFTEDTLLESFVFGAGSDAVAATCVAGRWI